MCLLHPKVIRPRIVHIRSVQPTSIEQKWIETAWMSVSITYRKEKKSVNECVQTLFSNSKPLQKKIKNQTLLDVWHIA
jgi:guanylate kinase